MAAVANWYTVDKVFRQMGCSAKPRCWLCRGDYLASVIEQPHSLRSARVLFNLEQRGSSLVAQMVKSLPATQETQVWFLGQEDPLEKKMVTHSSVLAWRIPWTEEPGEPLSMGSQRVGHDWVTLSFSKSRTYLKILFFLKTLCTYLLVKLYRLFLGNFWQ